MSNEGGGGRARRGGNTTSHSNYNNTSNNTSSGGRYHQHQNRPSRTRAATWMTADEIDRIMRIQFMTTHTDNPYRDDYCFQATRFKEQLEVANATGAPVGCFAPSEVRELLPTEKGSNRDPVEFLQVDGLGIVARPNTKAPKPLLDVSLGAGAGDSRAHEKDDDDDDDDGDDGSGNHERRALADEPMLAARCLIEDGECLLLDIDDVDRIISYGMDGDSLWRRGGVDGLMHRRAMLVDAVATSLHISANDDGQAKKLSKKKSVRDGVFLRVNLIAKGTRLFSRLITRLKDEDDAALIIAILHTVLRNVSHVFSATESHRVEANYELGEAVSTALAKIPVSGSPSVIESLVEAEGDLSDALLAQEELPLFVMSKKGASQRATGLGTIVLALLSRAKKCGSAPCVEFVDMAEDAIRMTMSRVIREDFDNLDADAKTHFEKLKHSLP